MPHICTRCNNIFDSGEDILKGCPVCGWKKFMFVKDGAVRHDSKSEPIITQSMGVRKPPKGRTRQLKEAPREEKEIIRSAPPSPEKLDADAPAQAHTTHSTARNIITARETGADTTGPSAAAPKKPAENHNPEDSKLESIKITAPGTYELNLPSLFEREELIMAVKEGTYFIDLTSAFRKGKKE